MSVNSRKHKPVVTLKNVDKSFSLQDKPSIRNIKAGGTKTIQVLQNLSLQVFSGEMVGVYGANGSGKSTLFRIISDIIKPDSGQVVVQGLVAPILEFGSGLHPEMTGRENIELYSSLLNQTETDIRKKESTIIEFSGIEEFIDYPLKNYSSGMRSRLAFSIALFSKADIFILDEIFAVGDQSFLDKSFSYLQKLRGKKTMIISSHNLDLLYTLCDRTLRLKDGQILSTNNMGSFFREAPINTEFISTVHTSSMAPVITGGEDVKIKKIPFKQVKVGDILAVYLSKLDQVIVHRAVFQQGDGFITKGDNTFKFDPWIVTAENYLGIVVER